MNVDIPCICGRHETDTVTLKDALGFREASAVRMAVAFEKLEDPDLSDAEAYATLREAYVLQGIESWSLMNGKGPLAVTKPNIREHLLDSEHVEEATLVAEAANDLYQDKVMLPLLLRASNSSRRGPMDGSTSVSRHGSTGSRRRSSRSSTATTPTADTETTTSPLAGVSST